jgi:hypothetical protein
MAEYVSLHISRGEVFKTIHVIVGMVSVKNVAYTLLHSSYTTVLEYLTLAVLFSSFR